jgi:prevent-host-death family protein
MEWRIAEAKERFSELIRAAADEPQLIFNRDRPVAVVVDAQAYRAYEEWRQDQNRPSLADVFAELRAVCADEAYELEVAPRTDRRNAFAEGLEDVSL